MTPTPDQTKYIELALSMTADCLQGRGTATIEGYAANLRRIADGLTPEPQPRPLRLSDINATTEPNERAAALWIKAQKLGLDAPTEGMIGEAINTAISEVLMWVGGPWHERYYDCRLDGTADRGPEGD